MAAALCWYYNCYSEFDDNFGADGATICLSFYSGSFDRVKFSNHRGPVVRVR